MGAGPAGAVAAAKLARTGFNVFLLEKRHMPSLPVRCGELTESKEELKKWIKISDKWIENQINGFTLTTTLNTTYSKHMPKAALKVNRREFDQHLIDEALDAGCIYQNHTRVVGLLRGKYGFAGVKVLREKTAGELESDIIIGADGVEGRVGRLAGLRSSCKPNDLYVCLQAVVSGLKLPRDIIHFYAGPRWVRRGYIWIFPKSDSLFTVGIAQIAGSRKGLDLKNLLLKFIGEKYPQAKISSISAGGIPITGGIKPMVNKNILLVGDAAHHAHPFSGGGILNAVKDGVIAGDFIKEYFSKKAHYPINLNGYEKYWHNNFKKRLFWQKKIRNLFYSFGDNDLDKILKSVSSHIKKKKRDGLNELDLLKAFILVAPRFISKARYLF
ncbi:MAG: NAD(P)/FAD-dependent oxidoreductase [bacterium]